MEFIIGTMKISIGLIVFTPIVYFKISKIKLTKLLLLELPNKLGVIIVLRA